MDAKGFAIVVKAGDGSRYTLRQLFLASKYGVNILRLHQYEPRDFYLDERRRRNDNR